MRVADKIHCSVLKRWTLQMGRRSRQIFNKRSGILANLANLDIAGRSANGKNLLGIACNRFRPQGLIPTKLRPLLRDLLSAAR